MSFKSTVSENIRTNSREAELFVRSEKRVIFLCTCILSLWVLNLKLNFSPLGLIFRALALLLSAQLCFVVLVPAFLEIIRVKLHVQKEKG